MTDQQIADVLGYVRNSFWKKAKAVTASEMKAVRAQDKKIVDGFSDLQFELNPH